MSLSAWEWQALNSIRDQLADSDPQLTALLISFTELASGESMPARERVRPSSRRAVVRSYRKRQYQGRARALRMYRNLMSRWALLLWLLVTAVLISVAVALSRGDSGDAACTGYWSAICAHPAPASGSPAASHGAVVSHVQGLARRADVAPGSSPQSNQPSSRPSSPPPVSGCKPPALWLPIIRLSSSHRAPGASVGLASI